MVTMFSFGDIAQKENPSFAFMDILRVMHLMMVILIMWGSIAFGMISMRKCITDSLRI